MRALRSPKAGRVADANTIKGGAPFDVRVVAGLVLAGALAFLGYLFLSAYAPEFRPRGGLGTATTSSKSAVGYSGIVQLVREVFGEEARIDGDAGGWEGSDQFLIVALDETTQPQRLRELLAARARADNGATLLVLPKWHTAILPGHPGWVQATGRIDLQTTAPLVKAIGRIGLNEPRPARGVRVGGLDGRIDRVAPPYLRTLSGDMTALVQDSRGLPVLGRMIDSEEGNPVYVLADPDLLSNQGLKTAENAAAAIELLQWLRPDGARIVFDDNEPVRTPGKRNLLQLMFEPPFLALTLAVLAAAFLAGLHAFGRFGPAIAEPRAIPFGKRALADNSAMLIARAGAARRLGDRYVALTRDAVGHALGAGTLTPDALEIWLGKLALPGQPGFAELADRLRTANTTEAVRSAAHAIHDWKRNITRDR